MHLTDIHFHIEWIALWDRWGCASWHLLRCTWIESTVGNWMFSWLSDFDGSWSSSNKGGQSWILGRVVSLWSVANLWKSFKTPCACMLAKAGTFWEEKYFFPTFGGIGALIQLVLSLWPIVGWLPLNKCMYLGWQHLSWTEEHGRRFWTLGPRKW